MKNMQIRTILLVAILACSFMVKSQLKSPSEFLGYELGTKFSRHFQIVNYYKHVAENSSNVKLIEYGRTYEGRELLLAIVTSKDNHDNIEQIRMDNLRRAGIESGQISTNVPIVWLSYNVHGNESNSTEASMKTLYELVRSGSDKTDWLEQSVVIIDPCINPDGRDRYVQFYWQYGNQPYNPDPQSAEHIEPWPGGRTNHYLFDLNRDWAWQTQIESQQRIWQYNQWMPHVHVDFHEQGYNSPYYFAPAAEPFHEQITDWQREFQIQIGKNHAKYFDENDWFYFTKQRFDLLYPSYGDTYPTYNGAIGMTYEQAGHGRGGLGIIKQEGDTLTLQDRIERHYTTGLSTIEVTIQNKDKVLNEFEKFFDSGVDGTFKSFIVKSANQDKLNALKNWLDANGIIYGKSSGTRLSGYNYQTKKTESFSVGSTDLVVSVDQPKGKLAKILFEPQTFVKDSLTYDITAWSVPYIYGLDAYATSTALNVEAGKVESNFTPNQKPDDGYAFLFKWNSFEDAKFLAAVLKAGIKVRYTTKPITYEGKRYDRGTIIISERDNRYNKVFEQVTNIANEFEREAVVISTGFAESGPDIGSGDIRYLKTPKIVMLGGDGTYSNEFGANWYYFEQELGYPVSIINTDYFSWMDLSEYDVLVMQEGRYGDFGDSEMKKITGWVREGGKLIVMQGALRKFIESDYSGLKRYNSDDEKRKFEKMEESENEANKLALYANEERRDAKNIIPGAIYRVRLDNTHPMAYGYEDTFYTLKTSSTRIAYLNDQNVGVIESKDDLMNGFVGSNVQEKLPMSLVFGVENAGRGQMVYFVDNPLFRAFWYNSKLMLANALFFVGQ